MASSLNIAPSQGDLRRAKVSSLGAMVEEYEGLLPYLTWQEREELDGLLTSVYTPVWEPFEGPQSIALDCEADELFYGGAAGGGKTDLILGAALTRHWRSAVFRREYAELKGIRERAEELYEPIGKFNGMHEIWRINKGQFAGKRIEFGACQFEGDERKFQGRPHDLKAFDEITQFTEVQYRFLITWNRTTKPGQRYRVIATGNPPVNEQGQWVIAYWAPWLDPAHPNPAKQGELRWFITAADGKDQEVDGPGLVEITYEDGERDLIKPKSRTFIRARVEDNPRLMESGYRTILQNLPEPLRSRMLRGDFAVGREDAEWQVIPTDWILKAQTRWAPTFEEYILKLEKAKAELNLVVGETLDTLKASESNSKPSAVPADTVISGPPLVGATQVEGPGVDLSALTTINALKDIDIDEKIRLIKRKIAATETGAVGVDVARGGRDDSIFAERLEQWFGNIKAVSGKKTRDGGAVIQILIDLGFSKRKIHMDVTGVGTSPVDIGKMQGLNVLPMVGSERSEARDRSGKLRFCNARSQWWWQFREALDPNFGSDMALPPDPQLVADLSSLRWTLTARGIQVEDKNRVKERLGRSPDKGDAVVMAHATPYMVAEAYLHYMKELSDQSKQAKKEAAEESGQVGQTRGSHESR